MAQYMGNGYEQAIKWYTEQKNKFLQRINQTILQEEQITKEAFLSGIVNQPLDDVDEIVNNLIQEIENIISQDGSKTKIRNYLASKYRTGQISKEESLSLLRKYIEKYFTPEYIKTKILSKLGTVGGKSLTQIDDNALLGKIKMLLSMGLRHEVLNPSNYTKKTVAGVLYEHAITGGMQKYFASIPELENIVQVTATGAKGGKGDITITLRSEPYNMTQMEQENLPERFEVQLKNYDIDEKMNSHATKITVGANMELLKEFMSDDNYNKTKEDSIYFLSQADRVINAIGRNTFLYGYSNGNMKFTSDLINQCRSSKPPYALGFSNLNQKNTNQLAYINWIRQKS